MGMFLPVHSRHAEWNKLNHRHHWSRTAIQDHAAYAIPRECVKWVQAIINEQGGR